MIGNHHQKTLFLVGLMLLISKVVLSSEIVTIKSKNLDSNPKIAKWSTGRNDSNTTFDFSKVIFYNSNTTHNHPSLTMPCDSIRGNNIINKYPIKIRNAHDVYVRNILVIGSVPMKSVWGPTYCNSAAILINNSAYRTRLSNIRMDKVWDGIRIGSDNSNNFYIEKAWISNARDDCIENDGHATGAIYNSLLDGCFQGISLREGKKEKGKRTTQFTNLLIIDKVLIRVQAHNHSEKDGSRERFASGNIFKLSSKSPSVIIRNSIFAYDTDLIDGAPTSYKNIMDYMGQQSTKLVECSQNEVLWLGNPINMPEIFNRLHEGFDVYKGQKAKKRWNEARCKWINENDDVRRINNSKDSRCETCEGLKQ